MGAKGIDRKLETADKIKRRRGRPVSEKRQRNTVLRILRSVVQGREHKQFVSDVWNGELSQQIVRGAWATLFAVLVERYHDESPCPICDGTGERQNGEYTRDCRACRGTGQRGLDPERFVALASKLVDSGRKCAELEALTRILEVPGHVQVDLQHPMLMPVPGLPAPPAELPDPRGDLLEVE